MMPSSLPDFKLKLSISIPALIFGVIVLVFSMINASWLSISQDKNLDRFRINPVDFQMKTDNGEIESVRYYLPQIYKTSVNRLYWLRNYRDQVWLYFSSKNKPIIRGDLCLLLADKRIAELLVLSQQSNQPKDEVYTLARDAVYYLAKAIEATNDMNNAVETDKIIQRAKRASYFYAQIFESIGVLLDEQIKYRDLVTKLPNV